MKKQFLGIFAALCLCLTLLPTTALAAGNTTVDLTSETGNITTDDYTWDKTTLTLTLNSRENLGRAFKFEVPDGKNIQIRVKSGLQGEVTIAGLHCKKGTVTIKGSITAQDITIGNSAAATLKLENCTVTVLQRLDVYTGSEINIDSNSTLKMETDNSLLCLRGSSAGTVTITGDGTLTQDSNCQGIQMDAANGSSLLLENLEVAINSINTTGDDDNTMNLTLNNVKGSIEEITGGGTVKLEGDVTLDSPLTFGGTNTLDLNGHTLTGTLLVGLASGSTGNLTIQDSSTNASGKVIGSGCAINVNRGSLTLESGTVSCFSGENVIVMGAGTTVTMKGGTVSAPDGCNAIALESITSSPAILNADGGTVNGTVKNYRGTITRSNDSTTSATTFTGTVKNGGTIGWGTYNGDVENGCEINGAGCNGTISGGIFYGPVTNGYQEDIYGDGLGFKGTISGGVFYGGITGNGEIIGTKREVAFDLNGGRGTKPVTQVFVNITTAKALKPAAPMWDGHTFDGWYEKENGSFKANAFDFTNTNITGDVTLYAKWIPNTYTVTYAPAAGGSSDEVTDTKNHGVALTLRGATFTHDGYTQTGWQTLDGKTTYDLGGSYTADAAVTLYPVWTAVSTGSSAPSYAVTLSDTEHGAVKANYRYAERGDTVTLTVTPDAGYVLETLTVLDKNGSAIELTDKGEGKYSFKMPRGKVTVSATFAPEKTVGDYFTDVPEDSYCADAVLWAARSGITGGIDATHFGPDLDCTRAQLATFLYRYAQLQGKGFTGAWMLRLPFTDVPEWCYEAVAWCYVNDIVGGYGNGLFGTDDAVTREQVVTILYRFAVAMGMDTSVGEDTNILSYNDVFEVSEYAISAFQWATGAGIVQGYDGNLMPKESCTRAQIVTMLYRLLGE